MKRIIRDYCSVILLFLLVLAPVSAQDLNHDGVDDATGAITAEPLPGGNPQARGPIHAIDLGALGLQGINSATWQHDPSVPAVNGALGYLWVGDSWNAVIHQIDTLANAVVASHVLSVNVNGLGWDGRYLLIHDAGGLVHQFDINAGAVVNTIASAVNAANGISWKPCVTPSIREYMFQPDFSTGINHQVGYFTPTSVFSYAAGSGIIGSLCDGWQTWVSDFTVPGYLKYDIASGALLATFNTVAVNPNPRDGTWDGHHLWDVTWQPTSWAWQYDLLYDMQMYEITVCPSPKHQYATPGTNVKVNVGIKNHSTVPMSFLATLMVFRSSGTMVMSQGPVPVTLNAGQVLDYSWVRMVPSAAPPGMYYIQTILTDTSMYEIHEDWCVVEI
jgi:hypothetical protein